MVLKYDNSAIAPIQEQGLWVNSKMSRRNPPVYYRKIPLIAMQEYQTRTQDTISLDYNSICYITSRIGWVSMKGVYKYRCRRDDTGKLSYPFFLSFLSVFVFMLLLELCRCSSDLFPAQQTTYSSSSTGLVTTYITIG